MLLPDPRCLMLVECYSRNARGQDAWKYATGYAVTADLVLTADHVLPDGVPEALTVRSEADSKWHSALAKVVWRDRELDAALIRLATSLPGVDPVAWAELPGANIKTLPYDSRGYPAASKGYDEQHVVERDPLTLSGTWEVRGGNSADGNFLDLGIASPLDTKDDYVGASGSPVFVEGRYAGLFTGVFARGRIKATPVWRLLASPGFRVALAPNGPLQPENLPVGLWVLVVRAEGQHTGPAERIDYALENEENAERLKGALGQTLAKDAVRIVSIGDAVATPERWLELVHALCKAPIALFDATGFQPGVMLALGVRSVVRRGVTLTCTADSMSDVMEAISTSPSAKRRGKGTEPGAATGTSRGTSALPFNIQETKLVCLGLGKNDDPGSGDEGFRIAVAIERGWRELGGQRSYLDLPAYDAVRCPYPRKYGKHPHAVDTILALCPFGEHYESHWDHLRTAVKTKAFKAPKRMRDVASPRLVGQALYEGIRWSSTCIVDWTFWRANVFFEFGVRLACAETGPVSVIDATQAQMPNGTQLAQHGLLKALFQPFDYQPRRGDGGIETALALHAKIVGNSMSVPSAVLPHNATFRACMAAFDWCQEHITVKPHELLRGSIEEAVNLDQQSVGRNDLLFSVNPDYAAAITQNVRERWIAAWLYLDQRNPESCWADEPDGCRQLFELTNQVLQFGLPDDDGVHRDKRLAELRRRVQGVFMKLRKLERPNPKG